MADKDVTYVSLTGLGEFYTKLKGELAKSSGSVLPVAYATAAGSATKDGANNTISTYYIHQVDFTPSGGDPTQPTALTPTNGAIEIDLSGYALKSEVASAMDYKGAADVNSLTVSNVRSGDVYTQNGNADVTGTGANAGMTFHPGYEYVAVVSGTPAALSWVELGSWFDHSDFLEKFSTVSAAGHIVTVNADGTLNESSVAIADLDKSGEVDDGVGKFVTGDQVYDYVTDSDHHLVNVIESISVNGTAQTITNKNVDITVPVAAQSIADGQTGYATGDQVYDYVSNSNYVTKVWDSTGTGTPAVTNATHVNNLIEAKNSDIDALFV